MIGERFAAQGVGPSRWPSSWLASPSSTGEEVFKWIHFGPVLSPSRRPRMIRKGALISDSDPNSHHRGSLAPQTGLLSSLASSVLASSARCRNFCLLSRIRGALEARAAPRDLNPSKRTRRQTSARCPLSRLDERRCSCSRWCLSDVTRVAPSILAPFFLMMDRPLRMRAPCRRVAE